nr:beta-ketoacyl synthase N-terminal-like domain-containing protein [Pseudohalocynthiibacter aestuariivivens]
MASGYNENPTSASRPFDRDRSGFVMSEGAGTLILETLDHAMKRGATPLAEIAGYGTSADAYHITSGPPDGHGAAQAMKLALRQAGIEPQQIDHINAHATSTPVGDAAEIAAIKSVFGKDYQGAISSTKSATGHTLGAAGAVEAIFTIMALRSGTVPPTLNLENPDENAEGLNLIGPHVEKKDMTYALSNAFGFGGVNASAVFCKWDADKEV